MVKSMETKSLWTGPNLRVKVALVAEEEAEVALEVELVAEVAEVVLVAEAGGGFRRRGGFRINAINIFLNVTLCKCMRCIQILLVIIELLVCGICLFSTNFC